MLRTSIGRVQGVGTQRLMLLGHVDTVVGHDAHQPLRRDGDRLYGTGTVDMKGGVVLSLGVARALARRPESFAELAVLLVTDEEWRLAPFVHAPRFAGYDACLCFEGGERTAAGDEGVVVRRKAAGTLRVVATGRASHSGSAPGSRPQRAAGAGDDRAGGRRAARPARSRAAERRCRP